MGSVIVVGYALGEDVNTVEGVALLVALYPIGTAVAVQSVSALLGTDADWPATLVDSAVAVPIGAAAGGLVGGAVYGYNYLRADGGSTLGAELLGLIAGGGVALGVASMWATRRVGAAPVQVAPVALVAPTGERAAGLTLAVGL